MGLCGTCRRCAWRLRAVERRTLSDPRPRSRCSSVRAACCPRSSPARVDPLLDLHRAYAIARRDRGRRRRARRRPSGRSRPTRRLGDALPAPRGCRRVRASQQAGRITSPSFGASARRRSAAGEAAARRRGRAALACGRSARTHALVGAVRRRSAGSLERAIEHRPARRAITPSAADSSRRIANRAPVGPWPVAVGDPRGRGDAPRGRAVMPDAAATVLLAPRHARAPRRAARHAGRAPGSPRRSGSPTRSGSSSRPGPADWAMCHRHRRAAAGDPSTGRRHRCAGLPSVARARGARSATSRPSRRCSPRSCSPPAAMPTTRSTRMIELTREIAASPTTSTPSARWRLAAAGALSDDGRRASEAGRLVDEAARRCSRAPEFELLLQLEIEMTAVRAGAVRAGDGDVEASSTRRRARPGARQGLGGPRRSGCSRSDARRAGGPCRDSASGSVLG